MGLDCGLRGGDIGDGVVGGEKIISELSFSWKSGRRGRLEGWETLGDGATRDGRGISGRWRVLKSSSGDVGNFINESLLSMSEKGELSSIKLLREEDRIGERGRGMAKASHLWEWRGENLISVRAVGTSGERGSSVKEAS